MRLPLVPAPATAAAVALLRTLLPGLGPDRHMAPEIEATVNLVQTGAILAAVEAAVGSLE